MVKFLKNFLQITIPTFIVIFLMLEVIFRFIIVASNTPTPIFDQEHKIIKYNNQANKEGIFSLGKVAEERYKWSVNTEGWNSAVEYPKEGERPKIAVIGDSYVEAFHVNNDESFPALLNKKNNAAVMSFGFSGAPLSQYLNMSRYVNKVFDPDVLIFTLVHNDFDESLRKYNPLPYFMTFDISQDSVVTEIPATSYTQSLSSSVWKKSAFLRYLIFNLKIVNIIQNFRAGVKKKVEANIVVDEDPKRKQEVATVIDYFCSQLIKENPNKKIVFIMDAPRVQIYNNTLHNCKVCYLNELVETATHKYNIPLIDMIEPLKENFAAHKKLFNSLLDGHWNAYGHQVVADTLHKFLVNKRLANF